MATKTGDTLTSSIAARFTKAKELVEKNANVKVMVAVTVQIAAATNREATALRDAGKIKEAKKLLLANGAFLNVNGLKYRSRVLLEQGVFNLSNAEVLDDVNWKNTRKQMRVYQNTWEMQQRQLKK